MALHTTPTIDKYTVKEVLNKVINTDTDALKVDIDNVTLTTEGSDIAIEVHLDKAEDSVLIYGNTNKAGSGTNYVPLVDADGHLQVDTLSSALPSGAATAANQVTIIGHVDGVETLLTAANVDHAANEALLITIDADTDAIKTDMAAIEVLLTSANVDHAANEVLLGTIDADTDAIKTDIAALEVLSTAANVDLAAMEVDLAAMEVLLTAANVDHAANEVLLGTIDADTGSIKTAVELIDDAVAVLGTATYSETSTKGLTVGAVRNDDLAALAGTDNEIAPLQVNASGALYTTEASGQAGSIFVADASAITSKISGTVFTAIQFIEDSVFDSGNTGLISATNQLYPSSQYEGTDIDDDGFVVDSVTFPQGMTIFGRWTGFKLVSGKVIAYIGYV